MKWLLAILALGQVDPRLTTDFEKAQETLSEKPNDARANLTAGIYHLVTGDADRARPYLMKGSDSALRKAATAEAERDLSNPLVLVSIGDLWTRAMAANRKVRQECLDRASYWYAKASPDLDGLWKDKLRQRLDAIYRPAVRGRATKYPASWEGPVDHVTKAEVVQTRVHSGVNALRITPAKDGKLYSIVRAEARIPEPGTLTFSAWTSSDGTDGANDKIALTIMDAQRNALLVREYFVAPDVPAWVQKAEEIELPDGAAIAHVGILMNSTEGFLWIDDLSVKLGEQELFPEGRFE